MANLRDAILKGIVAARRVHQQYDLQQRMAKAAPIDVFDLIELESISLCFRKLDKLYGAYLPLDLNPAGVLINSNHPLYTQRFTAAHELGHHRLGHALSLDTEIFERAPSTASSWNNSSLPAEALYEREADSFASELLMPKWLIIKCLADMGWSYSHLESPDNLYQLSLRLGVSYSAVCWGLVAQNILKAASAARFSKIAPQEFKSKLIPEKILKGNPQKSVWLINEKDNKAHIWGVSGDFFVFEVQEHISGGYEWNIEPLLKQSFEILSEEHINSSSSEFGGPTLRRIITSANSALTDHLQLVEKRPWNTETANQLSIDLRLIIDRQTGFYPKAF